MNSKLRSLFKYALLLSIALILLFFAFRGVDVKKMLTDILHANMFWVAVSGFLSIAAFVVRGHRWNLLIEPMNYNPSLKNTTYSLLIGYFANLALPRLGEVSRCGALSKVESIPFNKLLGTVIIERTIDVISLLGCMLLAAIIEFNRLGNFFTENIINPLLKKIDQLLKSPLLLVIAVVLAIILIAALYYYAKKGRKGTGSAFSRIIHGVIEGFRSVAHLKSPWLFIAESILIWVIYYLSVYTALNAFSFTMHLGSGAALFLLVAGGIGMSAPVQGGIGTYHLLVSQGLVLYGLTQQEGLTFATLLHTLQLILVVLFGVASLLILFSKGKRAQPDIY